MRKQKILTFLLLLSLAKVTAALEITSARSTALGDAFLSIDNDIDALRLNPASLGQLSRPQISFSYGRIYPQLDDSTNIYDFGMAAGLATKKLNLGFIWDERRLDLLYYERSIIFGAARKVRNLSLGLGLKILGRGYGENDYTTNAVGDDGMLTGISDPLFRTRRDQQQLSLDIGGQLQKPLGFSDWALALAIRNLNEPNMAMGDVSDPVYRKIALGICWHPEKILLAIETTRVFDPTGNYSVNIGLERSWKVFSRSQCFFRAGAASLTGSGKISLGLGYQEDFVRLDYSFVLPFFATDIGGIHKVTFGLIFGPPPPGEKYYQSQLEQVRTELRTKQQEIENIREEKIRLQEELNRTLNDINDYQKRIDYYQQVIATMSVNQPAAVATQELKKPAVVSPAETRKPEVREIPTDRKIRQEKLRQEYYYSLSYYYKLRELGITPKERYDILTRIQRKYRELGELKEIEEELRKITPTPLDK